jgi:hypothetical protein
MSNLPFTSPTFTNIWKRHFQPNKKILKFNFINGLSFYKSFIPCLFINTGRNLTKGNLYNIENNQDYKNKAVLIYDVLPHLNKKSNNIPENIRILKSKQYSGFLVNVDKFKSIDEYLLNTFSKNTRMKMRKFNKRLNECFNISTKMYFGNIDKHEYNEVFEKFMLLLQKRYSDKQILYNNMQPSEWNFYKDVAYPLILEKKASLFVVYDNKTPIAITYNYHTKDSLIDAITVFDTDYTKFNIGYVNNLKLLNWCFDNNIKTLDFTKGYFDYKKRMCTLKYDFEYHIIYDKKSISSEIIALLYYNFLEFKSYLRNNKLDVKFHKLTYLIKNKKKLKPKEKIKITKLDALPIHKELQKISIKESTNFDFLTKYVNDFLYLVVLPYNKVDIYKVLNQQNAYIFSSDSLIQQIKFIK